MQRLLVKNGEELKGVLNTPVLLVRAGTVRLSVYAQFTLREKYR